MAKIDDVLEDICWREMLSIEEFDQAKQALYKDMLELTKDMFNNVTVKPHQQLNEALEEKFSERLKEYFGVE